MSRKKMRGTGLEIEERKTRGRRSARDEVTRSLVFKAGGQRRFASTDETNSFRGLGRSRTPRKIKPTPTLVLNGILHGSRKYIFPFHERSLWLLGVFGEIGRAGRMQLQVRDLDLTTMPHPGEVGSAAYKRAWRQHRKSVKTPASEDLPYIRSQEKYFKAKFPPPSLERVLDLATRFDDRKHEINAGVWKGSPLAVNAEEISCLQAKGGQNPLRRAFHLADLPGEYPQFERVHGVSPTS